MLRGTLQKGEKEVWVKMYLYYSIYSTTFKLASYISTARPHNTWSISETQIPCSLGFEEGLKSLSPLTLSPSTFTDANSHVPSNMSLNTLC